MDELLIGLLAIVLGSIIPPIAYMLWIRRGEKFQRESLGNVLKAFAVGATLTVILGVVITFAILIPLMLIYMLITGEVVDPLMDSTPAMILMTAVIAAPLAEEFSKTVGIRIFKDQMGELENGIVYGAAVGLGFAATENILYGYDAFTHGLEAALLLVALRSVVSALGHASFSSISGYGVARWHRSHKRLSWVPFFLLAAVLHGFFNFVASISGLFSVGEAAEYVSLGLLFVMSITLILFMRHRIVQLDRARGQQSVTGPGTN